MSGCSFEKLLKLLDEQLDLDSQLDVFDHLDHCENCREAVYHIMRDRDAGYFVACPTKAKGRPAPEPAAVT